ncbi:MAG: glucokinase [Lentimonas sp.]|jgi:glucokinase
MQLTIGIDIGGTNTKLGIVTKKGEILRRANFRTDAYTDEYSYADKLAQECRQLMLETEQELGAVDCEWRGAGIGAPNGNSLNNSIMDAPNLNFKGTVPLADMLKQRIKLPKVYLTNDANAAAMGEKIYGGAKDYDNFIMITLGTGLGSGVYINNQLINGHAGLAGEMGHMTLIPDGRVCGFGRRGSLENYCSATGIRRTFFELLSELGQATALDSHPIAEIDAKMISDAAQAGDATCITTIERTADYLGQALASIALVTQPAAFFLFGGPIAAGPVFINQIRRAFESHLIPTYRGVIKILTSELPASDAALLGAAALVLDL